MAQDVGHEPLAACANLHRTSLTGPPSTGTKAGKLGYVPWEPIPEDTLLPPSAFFRKAKLYADEDIEEDVVESLRESGVNIESARELGHRGKPDQFHASLALRKRRFLLTKNAKDFLDDRRFPVGRAPGVIVLKGDMARMEDYARAVLNVLRIIVPYGELFEGSKIVVSASRVKVRFIDAHGLIIEERFMFRDGMTYRWVPQ